MKNKLLILSVLAVCMNLVACDSKKNTTDEITATSSAETIETTKAVEAKEQMIPAVWAKPYKMDVVNNEICQPESEDAIAGCTIYDVQSIKTNIDWINTYYDERLRKLYADTAFAKKNDFKLEGEEFDRKFYEGSLLSFVNQQYQLVTFSQFNNSYSGGAHNMFNLEYDVFDLKLKKKLTLNDIFTPNAKAKVLALLKTQNQEDLTEYQTDLTALELTENFYFGENGLVFVYAPYEIAAFAYGMPELTISYRDLAGLLKPEYIPHSPDYSLSEDFS